MSSEKPEDQPVPVQESVPEPENTDKTETPSLPEPASDPVLEPGNADKAETSPNSEPALDSATDSEDVKNAESPSQAEPVSGSALDPQTATKAEQPKQPESGSETALNPEEAKKVEPPPKPEPIDDAVRQTLIEALQANLEYFSTLPDELTDQNLKHLLELRGSMPDLILQISKSKTAGLDDEALAFARLLKAVTLSDQHNQQIVDLITSAEELTHKNTNQLIGARKLLRQFKSEIGWPQEAPKSALFNTLLATEQKFDEIAEKNQQFQEQLLASTKELADTLGKALEQGNSSEASALWDKIQGNINNLSGRAQHDFKLQTAEFRNQVNELRGWKKFAATEKKKELIERIRQLAEAKVKPSELAKQINKLHEEWKRLGYSNQNEKLWREFKTLSDQAYAPCKEYFKQQKATMAENLKQRTEICNKLKSFLEELDREAIKIVELKKFEEQAQEDWKKYAPIEQSKVKKLQKRFYELLNQVRDIRRTAAKKNGELKLSLVEQAKRLIDLEDRREAMNKARDLQAEWKTIGPSFFKEDRKHWEDFRAACDAIFKERDEARKALKSDIDNALKASKDILRQLDEIFEQEEEMFRQSRKLFSSLQRDFNQALSPKIKKERQQLLDRFTTLTRKIEARYRKLPDKKQMQALSALQARANTCLVLENQLLACKDDESLKQLITEIDQDDWQQLDNSGMPELDKAMAARWKSLANLSSLKSLQKLTDETEQQARRKVVEAEISASLDSPEQDKGLRMQLQLNQLTTCFGKTNMNDKSSREREARQLQLQFLCVGPLSQQVREELEPRVAKIIEKLL